jgi:dihydroxy-acid dehydratase
MLNGWYKGERTGSGTIVWKARELMAAGEIDYRRLRRPGGLVGAIDRPLQHHGHGLDDEFADRGAGHDAARRAAIPAPYRDRQQMAYLTGKRIVEMVWEDLKPSDILTREAFENAIVVNSAIGGSTNAPIHVNAIARHIGVDRSTIERLEKVGYDIPLLVNLQPAGEYLGEDYYRAGGVPAVVAELIAKGKIQARAHRQRQDAWPRTAKGFFAELIGSVIKAYDEPMKAHAGFLEPRGNLFDSAIMKTSVITPEFRKPLSGEPGRSRWPSRARPSCSMVPRTTTTASTIRS